MTSATIENPPRNSNRNRTFLTIALHNADGAERKKFTISEKIFFLIIIASALIAGVNDEIDKWGRRDKIESLRPTMEVLANQGQDSASLWMIEHYWSTNQQRLAPLLAKGNAEAMFRQGVALMRAGDKESARHWIERAAAAGDAKAIATMAVYWPK